MMTIHRPGRSVSRSVGHTGGVITSRSGGICIKSLSGISLRIQKALSGPQPRHSFAPCGHPSGKRLRLDAREKMHHLTVSIAGGQPAGVLYFVFVFHTHRQVILLLP